MHCVIHLFAGALSPSIHSVCKLLAINALREKLGDKLATTEERQTKKKKVFEKAPKLYCTAALWQNLNKNTTVTFGDDAFVQALHPLRCVLYKLSNCQIGWCFVSVALLSSTVSTVKRSRLKLAISPLDEMRLLLTARFDSTDDDDDPPQNECFSSFCSSC